MSTHDDITTHIRSLIALGQSDAQIREQIKAEHPALHASTRAALVRRAHAELDAEQSTPLATSITHSIQRLQDLYRRSLHIQDYKACASIERQLMDLRRELAALTTTTAGQVDAPAEQQRPPIGLIWSAEA